VDPIVALPKAFVGIPSLLGEKPASVMLTVSSARAAPAQSTVAQKTAAPVRMRLVRTIVFPHLVLGAASPQALPVP
jgi:hypothetical protein